MLAWYFTDEKKSELDANPLDHINNPVRPKKKKVTARVVTAEVPDESYEDDMESDESFEDSIRPQPQYLLRFFVIVVGFMTSYGLLTVLDL